MEALAIVVVLLVTIVSVITLFPTLGTFHSSADVSGAVIATVSVKCCPHGVAFDPLNRYIYATNASPNGAVSVINGTTNTVAANINVGSGPETIAFDPSNGYLYVTNPYSGTVSIINGTTNSVVTNISVGSFPTAVTFDPINNELYIANPRAGCSSHFTPDNVSVFDASDNGFRGNISVGAGPNGIALDSQNGYIYVANYCWGGVSVINGSSNKVVNSIGNNVLGYLNGIAFDSLNGCLYVAGYEEVYVINGSTDSVVATIGTYAPSNIAFNPSNGYVYVTNRAFRPDNVSVIDGRKNVVVANVAVGNGPYGIAFDPLNGYMYVANSGSGTISVIATTNSSNNHSISSASSLSQSPSFTVSIVTPSGQSAEVVVTGNISISEISNMALSENSANDQFSLSFSLVATLGGESPVTMGIPKVAVPDGYHPLVYIDGSVAADQSYYSDQSNYYVTFTAQLGTHEISIVFSQDSTSHTGSTTSTSTSAPTNLPTYEIAGTIVIVSVATVASFVVARRRHFG